MGVSKSGFYKWLDHKDEKKVHFASLEEEIKKIHIASRGTYGRRRVLHSLKKSFFSVGKKRVSKIMKKLELRGVGKPKFKLTTKVSPGSNHCPDLITGDFFTHKPDQLWTSDITYIPTKEGWLYLCVILDTFSRKIIGWSADETMKKELVLNSLDMAFKNRSGFRSGIIFQRDRK
jgi:putative transposase